MPPKDQESEPKDSRRALARIGNRLERATTAELIELLLEISKQIRRASAKKRS
jgi:hypothetical protein